MIKICEIFWTKYGAEIAQNEIVKCSVFYGRDCNMILLYPIAPLKDLYWYNSNFFLHCF